MAKRGYRLWLLVFAGLLCASAAWVAAQEAAPDNSVIRKVVDMVQLNVAVTDSAGKYIAGLRPSDFSISEDRIPQTIATFEEGTETLRASASANGAPDLTASLIGHAPAADEGSATAPSSGASVFILFDTSNYMFRDRGFVFAQDSIAEFVRSLDSAYQVAFYSYSRDLSREALLTPDRSEVLRGVRGTVNGDDSALYDALLMTLKDAALHTGRKVLVVFSNGPDNSSMVPPEDVGELAQSEGVPIYMVSTKEAKLDPVSATVFNRISTATGGESYFTKDWQEQQQAFASIRNDLAHLYLLSYYPQGNSNRGWRTINVKLVGSNFKKYHVRTRNGYRPLPARVSVDVTPAP